MTQQDPLFDLPEGRRRRDEALDRYEQKVFVEEARQAAFQVCKRQGYVSTDDLRDAYPDLEAPAHQNIWGAVLRSPFFVKIGEVQTRRPVGHARWIHKWAIGPEWQKYR